MNPGAQRLHRAAAPRCAREFWASVSAATGEPQA